MAEVQLCAENWRRLIHLDQLNLLVGHRISLQLSTNPLLCWVHIERLSFLLSFFLPFFSLPPIQWSLSVCVLSFLSLSFSLPYSAIFSFHLCILMHFVLSCTCSFSTFDFSFLIFDRKDKETLRKLTTETASLVCWEKKRFLCMPSLVFCCVESSWGVQKQDVYLEASWKSGETSSCECPCGTLPVKREFVCSSSCPNAH